MKKIIKIIRKTIKAISKKKTLIKVVRITGIILVYALLLFILLGYGKKWIALLALLLLFWKPYRYVVFNADRLLRSFVVNSFNFFRYREYNYPKDLGVIDGYVAHTSKVFGCCKTLSAVAKVHRLYTRYNGARTFDYKCKNPHWITWKVNVIANLEIDGVPVTPFKNMQQLVDLGEQDNSATYNIVLIDECNAVLNSRNFKNNFQNEEQIKSLVTCRHNNMYIILVGQRFRYLDALVRNIMDRVIECRHIPLFNTVIHYVYSAYDLETCDNPRMVKKLTWDFMHIPSWMYKMYDTKALVNLITKEKAKSSKEVLAGRQKNLSVYDTGHLTRSGKKLVKG